MSQISAQLQRTFFFFPLQIPSVQPNEDEDGDDAKAPNYFISTKFPPAGTFIQLEQDKFKCLMRLHSGTEALSAKCQ